MAGVSIVSIEAGGIGVLTIDSPPVNALGIRTRLALQDGFAQLLSNDAVKAIVLICAGRTFFAGADISEFGKPVLQPDLPSVFHVIENATKPVIAAIHGTALGGGYETALVCHYRIAVPSAKVGLPEVNLGLLPGAGGTQRLPRIVGVEAALDIIGFGKPIPAERALELGMIDALAGEGSLREDAIAFALEVVATGASLQRVRDRQDKIAPARGRPEIFSDFLKRNARTFRGYKAPGHIVKAIAASVEASDFESGMAQEGALFDDLMESTQSEAQRYFFFAERETAKIPDIPSKTPTSEIASVGVIGAGTMGSGIAMTFLNAGIPVVLVETDKLALDRGLATIRAQYDAAAGKGRITSQQVEDRMALIRPALDLGALGDVNLVIEAAFEEIALKKSIFASLDKICNLDCILASNTSFLNIDEIASATKRPDFVVGLHFFSPANVMRLLEVVRGEKTSPRVVATAMKLAKRIGKVPVLSRVGPGFIANRIMRPYMRGSDEIVLEGPTPPDVDAALFDYGFAMGPFQMIDLVGLDVIGRDDQNRSLSGDLVKRGRLGQKSNGGYYDYDDARRATFSPVAAEVIADFVRDAGRTNNGGMLAETIVARLLYPVVNEAAKVLEEGIALRPSDVDVTAILGYNWPIYTGGPMFWADTIGLNKVVHGLREMGIEPAALLIEKANAGERFTQ